MTIDKAYELEQDNTEEPSEQHERELPDSMEQDVDDSQQGRWNRRHFLTTTLSSMVTLIATACGRNRETPTPSPTSPSSPIPTPTPLSTATSTPVARSSLLATPKDAQHKTYLPYVENSGDDAAVAVAQEPTATFTPEETPTPTEPLPTPTPQATPFPPGPPSKLGVHVERNVPELFDLLQTQAMTVVTTLELDANFAAQIKQTSPRTALIGRLPIQQLQLSAMGDPYGTARSFVEQLLPFADDDRRRPYFDGWIAYNEPVANSADEMKRLADFESERIRLLGDRGIRSVVGNFATGGPDLPLWEYFLPAIRTAQQYNGWLGLHEYSAPTIYYLSTSADKGRYPGVSPQDDGWLTLRYRKVYNQFLKPAQLAIPLVFTECGVDGLVQAGRPGPSDVRGWRDFQSYWAENGYGLWGPGAYIEQLVWFDQAMQQDDYVIGGSIYGLGTSAQWLSYDLAGPAAGVLEQYLSVHAPG
ncbi:hypothetical protein KFU94_09745 [Chloroflexi bacterium TSY]|nr:hypothetical protein [Chloroflexi bacterium TSY]